jgi:F1F0 ATPase subunit 2
MSSYLALHLSLAFAAGIVLGLFYFGTLWWTIQYLTRARRPELVSLGGFLVRTGLTLVGFYIVMDGHWERALVCLLGFFLMRRVLVRRFGSQKQVSPEQG